VTPNPDFKVTGYLKVEYLADGARVFNCTQQSCRSLGALPKTCKKLGVVAENFLLKALKHVLHHWQKLSISVKSSLKNLRIHTAYQRKVLATTMDG